MRVASVLAFLAVAALLSGCAVTTVAGAAIGAGASVASTAVDVTTDVAGAAARTVTGSDKDDQKDKD